jgi:hypothetical protein
MINRYHRSITTAGLLMLMGCSTPATQKATPITPSKPARPNASASVAPGQPASPQATPTAALSPTATATVSPALTRTIAFQVYAPSIQASNGTLINEDPQGLLSESGLNLIAQGGGNLIGSNGGTLVTQGGGNYRLLATPEGLARVNKAIVSLTNLNGDRLNLAGIAGADGSKQLANVPDGEDLIAVAQYRIKGKTYRLQAAVPQGDLSGFTVFIDPINTFVASRIRAIYQQNGKKLTPLSAARLKYAWDAFYEAKIDVDPDLLENSRSFDDLLTFYARSLVRINKAEDRKKVEDFMAELSAQK